MVLSSKRLGARLWKMPSRMMGRMKVTNLVRVRSKGWGSGSG